MKRLIAIAAAVWASLGVAMAQDFSEGSEAKPWNLNGEEKARFTAKVVDVLCELTGDCADNCGDGRRQLGLVRDADGALMIVMKNGQPVFSGAVADLLPYCNQAVEVDGLLVGEGLPAKLYQVQRIRAADGEWAKTNRFTKDWNKAYPEQAKLKGPWFRKDPRVTSRIEAEGYLGLGLEIDAAFIEEEFGE